ncbi:hypothetical protein Leryth_019992 [Lithospermum erythrorhizon]|nr:hypothetical protein Leryth_019992 [Lithospermum erythrorhizon]
MVHLDPILTFIFAFFFTFQPLLILCIRSFPNEHVGNGGFGFMEAPEYRNGVDCEALTKKSTLSSCDASLVHIAMTIDSEYLRGSMAVVNSVLRHATCPESVFFHFIADEFGAVYLTVCDPDLFIWIRSNTIDWMISGDYEEPVEIIIRQME